MRGRTAMAALALGSVAALPACGPPGETPAAPSATTTPTASTPLPVGPAGSVASDALAGFGCGPDRSGAWSATGTLTNDGSARAAYVLTVLVAGPTAGDARAKRQVLEVASGETVPVSVQELPVPAEGELSCQAQVVRRR